MKILYSSLVFFTLLLAIAISTLLIGCSAKPETPETDMQTEADTDLERLVKKTVEEAYFEGQRDAIEGDIRIENTESGYRWIKSPWDDGSQPYFDPKYPTELSKKTENE